MAENKKPMSFLQIGDETFEVIDEQARDNLITTNQRIDAVDLRLDGLNWVKNWENSNPNAAFAEQSITFNNDKEMVIEYKEYRTDGETKFMHFKRSSSRHEGSIDCVGADANGVFVAIRVFDQGQISSELNFYDAYKASGSTAATVDNDYMIPIAIYSVETPITDGE